MDMQIGDRGFGSVVLEIRAQPSSPVSFPNNLALRGINVGRFVYEAARIFLRVDLVYATHELPEGCGVELHAELIVMPAIGGLVGTVISGFLRFFTGIRVFPELQLIPLPERLLLPNFLGNTDPRNYELGLLLLSTLELGTIRQFLRILLHQRLYKPGFWDDILFRIICGFGYYSYTSASSGGDRA